MSVEPNQQCVICVLADLSDPGTREFTLGEGDWPLRGFVVRYRGEVRAYLNSCPHAGHPLNWKPNSFFAPNAESLICASHGALFEALTGECVAGPCLGQSLRALDIEIANGQVLLKGSPDILQSYWA